MNGSRSAGLVAVAVIAFAGVVVAQGQPGDAKDFVQRFYDWYSPMAERITDPPAWGEVLKSKHDEFGQELRDLLAKDFAAKAKCDDIVGIDSDPFLNFTISLGKYHVGGVRERHGKFEADVFAGGAPDDKSEGPVVVAVVERHGKEFRFVNFLYPELHEDLIAMLKAGRKKCEHPRN